MLASANAELLPCKMCKRPTESTHLEDGICPECWKVQRQCAVCEEYLTLEDMFTYEEDRYCPKCFYSTALDEIQRIKNQNQALSLCLQLLKEKLTELPVKAKAIGHQYSDTSVLAGAFNYVQQELIPLCVQIEETLDEARED